MELQKFFANHLVEPHKKWKEKKNPSADLILRPIKALSLTHDRFKEMQNHLFNVTINSMNKSNRWRVTDNLQTEEKRRKEEKNGGCGGYLRPRMQEARSALDVLHEVLCSSQSKQSSLRSSFIISRKFHHFSMRYEISMTRALDNASFR